MYQLKPVAFALSWLGVAIAAALMSVSALVANEPFVQLAQYQVLELDEPGEAVEENPSVDDAAEGAEAEAVPQESRFTWIVNKTAEGFAVSGNIPDVTTHGMLSLQTEGWLTEEVEAEEGAPTGFYRDATAVLQALDLVEEGRGGFDGTFWFVEGVLSPDADEQAARQAIAYSEEMGGPWAVALEETSASAAPEPSAPEEPEPEPVAAKPDYAISAIKDAEGTLKIRGSVPDAATRARLARMAGGPAAVEDVTIDAAAPEGFTGALFAGMTALEFLQDGRVAFDDGAWLISGNAGIETDKDNALDALEQAGVREGYRAIIAAPSARSVCEAELTAFMDSNAILFGSGSTRMTSESETLLPQVVEYLSLCPDAVIYVEGHTDSDGLASANLSLSIARAEAVVDALIELGIAPHRLYAVGYGESLPVASNETQAGKLQNRRIVFSFEDRAEPIEPEEMP